MMNKCDNPQVETTVAGWFLTLRWGTVLCQVLLFAAVRFLFAMETPPLALALIIFEVVSNLFFTRFFRVKQCVPIPLLTGVMFLDIALLTGLLAVTGGAMNPFTFLYLVHVVVGAILLPMAMAWGIAGFAALCYGGFFLPAAMLGSALRPIQSLCHTEPLSPVLRLHLQGMWVAFVITAFFVVFFVTRIQEALAAHRQTESRLRESQLKNERLASLAALSAGAAHEFATPLSTIAVAAGELYREMSQGAHDVWLEDLRLIRSQVARCRDILSQMAADAGEPLGEGIVCLRVEDLMDEVRLSLDTQRQRRLEIDCPDPDATITIPKRSLHRVLRGLVSNAFHASPSGATVNLRVVVDHGAAHFTVRDTGHGMDEATLSSAREPFFTTKDPGQGLGLGLYLASTMAERLGGGLDIDSESGKGTTVHFWIPRV